MGDKPEETCHLLVLAADDNITGFEYAVHVKGGNPHETSSWYHRHYALRRMGRHAVTSTMISSLYGSLNVLRFILSDIASHDEVVNMTCGTDKATPLHYAAAGCSLQAVDTVRLLLYHGADVNAVDAHGLRPVDVMRALYKESNEKLELEKLLLNGITEPSMPSSQVSASDHSILQVEKILDDIWASPSFGGKLFSSQVQVSSFLSSSEADYEESYVETKELSVAFDVKKSMYMSDEFRMFSFKVRPCSRAYSHDWTECPFVHNGENARRRDPRKFHYSCVPCPDFRKGVCVLGDRCEFAHGIFESWLHPAQYRTRLCKDGIGCTRRVCFFAHAKEELRALYITSGCAVSSSGGPCVYNMSGSHGRRASPLSSSLLASPFSQVQKPQKICSTINCPSPELTEGSWMSKDLLALRLPHAGGFHGNPVRMTLNTRDSSFQEENPQFSLKSPSKPDESFKLENLCASVDVRASHESLSMSSIKCADHADQVFSEGMSPPTALLPLHMPSLLSTPWRMHMHLNMHQSSQEWVHMHPKAPLPLPMPLQAFSPIDAHPITRAQVHTSFKRDLTDCMQAPMHCSNSVIQAQNNVSWSFQYAGSSWGARCAEIEMPNVNMSSKKVCSCPVPTNSCRMQRFLISDWGSPTGKLEWGVQKEDLHRLRWLTAHGSDVIGHHAFCGASLSLSSEGSYNTNIESDSVLGFWLEQMQLDEIMT